MYSMATDLLKKKCVPCEGGVDPFTPEQIKEHMEYLTAPWDVIDNIKIRHEFKLESFRSAIEFVNKIADLAEDEGHHPDIHIYYKRVVIELWTHAIKGLSLNDFILAAKIENIFNNRS